MNGQNTTIANPDTPSKFHDLSCAFSYISMQKIECIIG